MNGNGSNERTHGQVTDTVRPNPSRVPLGISGRLHRDRTRHASGGRRVLRARGGCREPEESAALALAPKKPHFPGKAKACIVLFMYGGVSQVDTFDPKNELTKHNGKPIPTLEQDPVLKLRNPGKLLASSRKFARTGQAGTTISDLFPHLAKRLDDIAVIRSMYADSFAHGSGLLQMNTGNLRQGFPSLGSWVTYGLGSVNQNLARLRRPA